MRLQFAVVACVVLSACAAPADGLGNEHAREVSGEQIVMQEPTKFQHVSHGAAELSDYQLRITSPQLCDPGVHQLSGYMDIADEQHLFFWFFEARNDPEHAPLILWLNGGPGASSKHPGADVIDGYSGASSAFGLLFELGPCTIQEGGNGTKRNPFSWNQNANIVFLDQPLSVGYSYATSGQTISTSARAAQDVWAFLQLFFGAFPKYAAAPFHIAAESYGGHYAPHIASVVHKRNMEQKSAARASVANLMHINLASLVLANGITEPSTQFAAVPEWLCEGPYSHLLVSGPDDPECKTLRSRVPTCQSLTKGCYENPSRLTCVPAALYCEFQLQGPYTKLQRNPYDVRKECDTKVNASCYVESEWIDIYLNRADVKAELGVDPERKYTGSSQSVFLAFFSQGDVMRNSAALLPELLDAGIRLLVYAGKADSVCNFMGNFNWMRALPNRYAAEFASKTNSVWRTLDADVEVGEVRAAGDAAFTAGNFTFVAVNEAGHMVPADQPEAALDLIERWIFNIPLSFDDA